MHDLIDAESVFLRCSATKLGLSGSALLFGRQSQGNCPVNYSLRTIFTYLGTNLLVISVIATLIPIIMKKSCTKSVDMFQLLCADQYVHSWSFYPHCCYIMQGFVLTPRQRDTKIIAGGLIVEKLMYHNRY